LLVTGNIEDKNLRNVECYLRYLKRCGYERHNTVVSSAQNGCDVINKMLDTFNDRHKKQTLIIEMKKQPDLQLLPLSEFSWLKENERVCNLVWVTIRDTHSSIKDWVAPGFDYRSLELQFNPKSTIERFNEIIKFFDRGCREGDPVAWGRNVMMCLLRKCRGILNESKKPFSWLKRKNEVQISWAHNYFYKEKDVSFKSNNRPKRVFQSPISIDEKYLGLYAAFDSWEIQVDSKTLFLHNFNIAWHQKKHRDIREGKKVCNVILDEDVKNKLDSLAKMKGLKLNETIAFLIEQEYQKCL
tara:strand:- start:124 stop:1020 length:897 start_codon:yes stop_codon:yes gene_type:complete